MCRGKISEEKPSLPGPQDLCVTDFYFHLNRDFHTTVSSLFGTLEPGVEQSGG
jgi:hypothetical protein